MFLPRIYYPFPMSNHQSLHLADDVCHYLMHVLRAKPGDQLYLFNGQGGEYIATITHRHKSITVQINEYIDTNRESNLHIQLGQGIARAERMDYVIQKSTELGVTEVSPLETKRSIVKLDGSRKEKRQQHWEKIAVSAAEQSFRTAVPHIHLPQPLKNWAAQPFDGISIYFDTTNQLPVRSLTPHTRFRIAIGPESGWDEEETDFLKQHEFVPLSLGPRILRTETAGVAAISIIQGLWGDLAV